MKKRKKSSKGSTKKSRKKKPVKRSPSPPKSKRKRSGKSAKRSTASRTPKRSSGRKTSRATSSKTSRKRKRAIKQPRDKRGRFLPLVEPLPDYGAFSEPDYGALSETYSPAPARASGKKYKPKPGRTPAQQRADKARSEKVRQRWAEAKEYARRHGTKPRLDKRTVKVDITREKIQGARELFSGAKVRLPGGRRGPERVTIPEGSAFRVTLVKPDGTMVQSDQLYLGPGAGSRGQTGLYQRAIRNAVFGTLRADTNYDQIGEVQVNEEGELIIDGEEWDILLEQAEAGEDLLPEFQAENYEDNDPLLF